MAAAKNSPLKNKEQTANVISLAKEKTGKANPEMTITFNKDKQLTGIQFEDKDGNAWNAEFEQKTKTTKKYIPGTHIEAGRDKQITCEVTSWTKTQENQTLTLPGKGEQTGTLRTTYAADGTTKKGEQFTYKGEIAGDRWKGKHAGEVTVKIIRGKNDVVVKNITEGFTPANEQLYLARERIATAGNISQWMELYGKSDMAGATAENIGRKIFMADIKEAYATVSHKINRAIYQSSEYAIDAASLTHNLMGKIKYFFGNKDAAAVHTAIAAHTGQAHQETFGKMLHIDWANDNLLVTGAKLALGAGTYFFVKTEIMLGFMAPLVLDVANGVRTMVRDVSRGEGWGDWDALIVTGAGLVDFPIHMWEMLKTNPAQALAFAFGGGQFVGTVARKAGISVSRATVNQVMNFGYLMVANRALGLAGEYIGGYFGSDLGAFYGKGLGGLSAIPAMGSIAMHLKGGQVKAFGREFKFEGVKARAQTVGYTRAIFGLKGAGVFVVGGLQATRHTLTSPITAGLKLPGRIFSLVGGRAYFANRYANRVTRIAQGKSHMTQTEIIINKYGRNITAYALKLGRNAKKGTFQDIKKAVAVRVESSGKRMQIGDRQAFTQLNQGVQAKVVTALARVGADRLTTNRVIDKISRTANGDVGKINKILESVTNQKDSITALEMEKEAAQIEPVSAKSAANAPGKSSFISRIRNHFKTSDAAALEAMGIAQKHNYTNAKSVYQGVKLVSKASNVLARGLGKGGNQALNIINSLNKDGLKTVLSRAGLKECNAMLSRNPAKTNEILAAVFEKSPIALKTLIAGTDAKAAQVLLEKTSSKVMDKTGVLEALAAPILNKALAKMSGREKRLLVNKLSAKTAESGKAMEGLDTAKKSETAKTASEADTARLAPLLEKLASKLNLQNTTKLVADLPIKHPAKAAMQQAVIEGIMQSSLSARKKIAALKTTFNIHGDKANKLLDQLGTERMQNIMTQNPLAGLKFVDAMKLTAKEKTALFKELFLKKDSVLQKDIIKDAVNFNNFKTVCKEVCKVFGKDKVVKNGLNGIGKKIRNVQRRNEEIAAKEMKSKGDVPAQVEAAQAQAEPGNLQSKKNKVMKSFKSAAGNMRGLLEAISREWANSRLVWDTGQVNEAQVIVAATAFHAAQAFVLGSIKGIRAWRLNSSPRAKARAINRLNQNRPGFENTIKANDVRSVEISRVAKMFAGNPRKTLKFLQELKLSPAEKVNLLQNRDFSNAMIKYSQEKGRAAFLQKELGKYFGQEGQVSEAINKLTAKAEIVIREAIAKDLAKSMGIKSLEKANGITRGAIRNIAKEIASARKTAYGRKVTASEKTAIVRKIANEYRRAEQNNISRAEAKSRAEVFLNVELGKKAATDKAQGVLKSEAKAEKAGEKTGTKFSRLKETLKKAPNAVKSWIEALVNARAEAKNRIWTEKLHKAEQALEIANDKAAWDKSALREIKAAQKQVDRLTAKLLKVTGDFKTINSTEIKNKLKELSIEDKKILTKSLANINKYGKKLAKGRNGGTLRKLWASRYAKKLADAIAELQKHKLMDKIMESVGLEGLTDMSEAIIKVNGKETTRIKNLGESIAEVLKMVRNELGFAKPLAGNRAEIRDEIVKTIISEGAKAKALKQSVERLLKKMENTHGRITEKVLRKMIKESLHLDTNAYVDSIFKAVKEGVTLSLKDGAKLEALGYQAVSAKEASLTNKSGLRTRVDIAIKNLNEARGLKLNTQGKRIMADVILRFQKDANYRNFTRDADAQAFLFRQAELHYLNLELHGKNSGIKNLIGTALQLAMGGGKSGSGLSMEVGRELFMAKHPGKEVPAMLYMTKDATLVMQMLKEGAFKTWDKQGILEVLSKDNAAKVIKNGFENNKVYIMENETLKHIVLEMRSAGKNDAWIANKLQKKLGTVAWDEFHAIFHTTDTIIGASGVWNKLSDGVREQATDMLLDLTRSYAEVRKWYKAAEKSGMKFNDMFVSIESGVNKEIRGQFTFNKKARASLLKATGFDYNRSGDAFILDKMVKVLSSKNKHQWSGTYVKGKGTSYGTMEGGVGKPNTIKGDTFEAALTHIEIFLAAMAKKKGFNINRMTNKEFATKHDDFIKTAGDALAHTTTERVTMAEAVQLIGAHNIVAFSGTFEGLAQRTLRAWGKTVLKINAEPQVALKEVAKGEATFTVKIDDKIISIKQGKNGNLELVLNRESARVNRFMLKEAMSHLDSGKDYGGKLTNQAYTHSDGTVLVHALKIARQKYWGNKSKMVVINTKTVERYIERHKRDIMKKIKAQGTDIKLVKTRDGMLDMADIVTRKAVEKAVDMMLEVQAGKNVVQLVYVDGMAPDLWSVAMDKVGKKIQTPEAKKDGKVIPAGWKQKRMLFAARIGEGLNTYKITAANKGMRAEIIDMRMSPLDVARQAAKRVGVFDKKTGEFRRAQGTYHNIIDLNDTANVKTSEKQEFKTFIKKAEAKMKSRRGDARYFEIKNKDAKGIEGDLIREFCDLLVSEGGATTGITRRILNEVDAAKSADAYKTQAGIQTEKTTKLSVSKTSDKYMPELAKKIEKNLPSKLREFQGVTDCLARRTRNQAGQSKLLQNPAFHTYHMRTKGLVNWIPGIGSVVSHMQMQTAALKNSAAQISLVSAYAKTWKEWNQFENIDTKQAEIRDQMSELTKEDPKLAESQEQMVEMQMAKTFGSTWQSDQKQYEKMKAEYGRNWFEKAMADKFGADWRVYQRLESSLNALNIPFIGKIAGGFMAEFVLARQPYLVRSLYNQSLQNIARVNAKIPVLRADAGKTITYQNQTMDKNQAVQYVQQNLVMAQSLANRYEFKQTPQMAGLQAQPKTYGNNSQILQRVVKEQLDSSGSAAQLGLAAKQQWHNLVRGIHRVQFFTPFFNVKNGVLIPSTPTKLLVGAAVVGAFSFTSLCPWAMMLAFMGITIISGFKKDSAKTGAESSNKMLGFMKKMSGGGPAAVPMAIVGLVSSLFFAPAWAAPYVVGLALGKLNSEVMNYITKVPEQDSETVIVNKASKDTVQAVAGGGVFAEFKKRMKGRDKSEAVPELTEILKESGVKLVAGEKMNHYGFALTLAALFDLVPNALESVKRIAVDAEADKADQQKTSVTVDSSSVKFLGQQFSESVLNQLIMAATTKLFGGGTEETLDTLTNSYIVKLKQHPRFKGFGNNAFQEFLKQYIMDGENLKILCTSDMKLTTLYEKVKSKMGREFTEKDMSNLAEASVELETEAFTLMKQKAAEIKTAAAENQPGMVVEFNTIFGMSYAAYQKMMKPSWSQEIFTKIVGKERLHSEQTPLIFIRSKSQQMIGWGAVSLAAGAALILGVGTVAPIILGIGAAVFGAALALEGTATWFQAKKMAFRINPTDTVQEQLDNVVFASRDVKVESQAKMITGKELRAVEALKQSKEFTKEYGVPPQTYQDISINALLNNAGFKKAIANLKIAGTEQIVSEESQNSAIRLALLHLLQAVESDAKYKTKIAIAGDITKILGFLGFNINMTYKEYADALSITLTPEAVPRTLLEYKNLGRIIESLEGFGVGIKLDMAPQTPQRKLKAVGAAA